MNNTKICAFLTLAAICMAFAPSKMEAREHRHCHSRTSTHVSVGVGACRPAPVYYQDRYIVRRPCPTVVERVYIPSRGYEREVVVVEEPYYEEVMVAPRPVCAVPFFGFSWNFFSR